MMQNLSMHVLDIAANAVRAEASLVKITLINSKIRNVIKITVEDNGKGMDEEQLKKVQDPFYTTRTTRRIGLGIPLFRELAEQCGGEFELQSKLGVGTRIASSMQRNHWDPPPMGYILL